MLYSPNWANFIVWLLLLLEILSNMCIVIIFFAFDEVINLKLALAFLSSRFLHDQKSQDKNLKYERRKRAFKMK